MTPTAGELRDRVQFALPAAAANNRGRAEWAAEGPPVWAKVEQMPGAEAFQAKGTQAVGSQRVTIRRPAPFAEADAPRLRAEVLTQGSRTLFVVGVNWTDDRAFLVLTCRSDG